MCESMRGEIDYILTYKMDRFGREVGDALAAIKRFRGVGVEVNFTDAWIDYQDPNHPLSLSLKLALAQTESLKISDRTKDGIYQSQVNGYYPFNAPPGYRKQILETQKANGSHLKVCVPDDSAPYVKQAFELFATGGYTQSELFRKLGDRIGTSRTQFYMMFSNPFYVGEIHLKAYKDHNSKIVRGKHQPIISRNIWERCQMQKDAITGSNKGHSWVINNTLSNSDYFLKGVLRCEFTDRHMTAYSVKKKSGKSYSYYATASGPRKKQFRADRAHQLMFKAIQDLKIDQEMYQIMHEELDLESKERHKIIEQSLKKTEGYLTREKSRLERVTEDYADGNIDGATYTKIREGLLSRIANYEVQVIENQDKLASAKTLTYKVMSLLSDISRSSLNSGTSRKIYS